MGHQQNIEPTAIAFRPSQANRQETEDKLLFFSTLAILVIAIVSTAKPTTFIDLDLEAIASNSIKQAMSLQLFGDRY